MNQLVSLSLEHSARCHEYEVTTKANIKILAPLLWKLCDKNKIKDTCYVLKD
jgi:hypothetical protein